MRNLLLTACLLLSTAATAQDYPGYPGPYGPPRPVRPVNPEPYPFFPRDYFDYSHPQYWYNAPRPRNSPGPYPDYYGRPYPRTDWGRFRDRMW
jgi:hypothetical protein